MQTRYGLLSAHIHELLHRLVSRRTSKDGTHHQKQRPAQGGRAPFGDATAANLHLPRLIARGINTRKSYQCLLGTRPAHITDFRDELGVEGRPNAKHLHHNRGTSVAMPPKLAFFLFTSRYASLLPKDRWGKFSKVDFINLLRFYPVPVRHFDFQMDDGLGCCCFLRCDQVNIL